MEATETPAGGGISSEVERETHEALVKHKGGIRAAAAELNIPRDTLKSRIQINKNLRLRWRTPIKPTPQPGEASAISRPPPTTATDVDEEGVLKSDEAIAAALVRENRKIEKGLTKMGLTKSECDLGIALQEFQGRHFGNALQLMGGGMTKQFLRVMVEIDKIDRRLEDGGEEGFPLTPAQETMLREDRRGLLEIMSKFSDKLGGIALTQAKVYQMTKGKDKDKSKKPGGFLDLKNATPGA